MALRRPPPTLTAVAGAAAVILLVLFVGRLADRWPFGFDRALIIAVRTPGEPGKPLGGPKLLAFMRDVTALGDGNLLTLIVIVVVGLLLVQRKWMISGLVVAATLSGSTLVSLAKLYTGRERPDLVPRLIDVSSLSFPSGHAANSAIVYLTLTAVAAQIIQQQRVRTYLLIVTLLLVALIGLSRIYLGVHWPSDVLAGWSFGALWAWSWWWVEAKARAPAPSGS